MKILVCVSKVPDTTTKVKFSSDRKSVDYSGVQFIINPYDEHGLAKALELKEKHSGSTITIINVGDASSEAIIRKCLAIGADEAMRVDAEPADAFFVAEQIAAAIKDKGFDLIITGRESIDYNGGQVCDLLGEMLEIPSVGLSTFVEVADGSATITRFVDGGHETLQSPLPLVLSATKELAEPRIPNMRGIMMARSKPIQNVPAADVTKHTSVAEYEPPKEKGECKYIDPENAGELIQLLHSEAKVI
ncbi:MAG: electron transfer flavoprotein subunit beta/FixA family protein [Bacteroidia bacterium]